VSEATRILAIRHGQTAWNADGRIQGHTDIGLDDTGQWQAERLAEALQGEALHALYSSDLLRARQTAQLLQRFSTESLRLDTGLRERSFGRLEGLSFAEIEERWPQEAARWRQRDPDFAPGGGETLKAFYARCVATAARLAAAHAGQTIVLVAHGGVLDMLYRAAAGLDLAAPRRWELGNASVNRLLYSPEGFSIVAWNERMHLEQR
jgi:2,3-bisphosphoglycerate-dependent phosphoglycerate mutase